MTGAKAGSPPVSTSAPGRPAGHDWEGLHRDFQRDGAVLLRGLFSEADMALLRAGVEAHLADPGPEAATASPSGDPGRFWEDFRGFWRHQAYQDFVRTSPAAEAAHRLTGSPEVRLHHDHLLIKEAGARQKTPWHQDQPYYDFEGSQTVSLWIPLDPVPLEASLRFAARTHLGPWLIPRPS